MSDVKNVLVFPAGTEIALEIHDALKFSKFVRLFGATSVACHAEFVFENCVGGVPFVDDPALIDSLNEIIDKYHIDYVYPAHDSALLTLTRERARLHAVVVTSDEQTVEICRSKNKTYEYLAGADYLPQSYPDADSVSGYPVFIKPSVGQGAVGARHIDDREHLDEALADGVEYAICEYLPGEEFTVDCFTDRHGVLRFVGPRSRARIRAGISVRSREFEPDAGILAVAQDINRRMRFNGAWFFQLKKNAAGEYRLMEIAPRIAGTMCMARNLGVNMPLLTLYNMWGYDVGIINNRNAELVDRAFINRFVTDIEYDRVYVDFDDTVTVRGRANSILMMYLYQARNAGKHLVLLTKHAEDIQASMDRYAVSPRLFDEIIHIAPGADKSEYIKPNSIFIDDSFAERKTVLERCGIPVFDLDMVESLLDWRA